MRALCHNDITLFVDFADVKKLRYVASVNFPSRTRASFRRSPRLTSSFIRAALCRQLSGGHRGDRKTDRTAGKAAVADFAAFEKAGITTFDTADIYGPSQELIGEFIKQRGNGSEGLQVLTKFCCFGPEMQNMTSKFVERGIDDSRRKLGIDDLDLVQVSESVRRAAPATDPPHQVLLA